VPELVQAVAWQPVHPSALRAQTTCSTNRRGNARMAVATGEGRRGHVRRRGACRA
jgi:hypothetical protein